MTRFFGGLLLAIGILLMTGSGLCTTAVIVIGLSGGMGVSEAVSVLPLPLIVGGIPFGVGFGLFTWGRSLLRKARDLSIDELENRFE